ncbi:MAG TPA: hypothetical protein VES67_15390 [Vicinamibacterales bacterium]|nr:hypothetical protein [Vicinamibacterales bacterium]
MKREHDKWPARPAGTRWATIAGISGAVALFGIACGAVGAPLPVNRSWLVRLGGCGLVVPLAVVTWRSVRMNRAWDAVGVLTSTALVGGVWFMFLVAAYRVACLLALPVDLLSYSEAGFVNDILRIRLGLPIYAPPLENQSTVYTPGSPVLTGWVAGLFSDSLDIPVLRAVQFGYVILAAAAATAAADRLARLVTPDQYRESWRWIIWWAPMFFMVAIDPLFNPYTPSLNSDGLALCVSMIAFLLMTQHALAPRDWHLVAMAVLPAAGFFVKQNLLAWVGLFSLYLLLARESRFRAVVIFSAAAGLLGLGAIAAAYWLWGPDFWFWAFTSYSAKAISLPRSGQHLLAAGSYLALGLAAGWMLLRRPLEGGDRRAMAAWVVWLALIVLQAYTSGFAWALNHLGPSVLMAAVWFAVTAVSIWPRENQFHETWRLAIGQGLATGLVLGVLGGLGFAREPRTPVPRDLPRYVAAIEAEFARADPSRILMDQGSWIYAQRRIVMKDRGYATHVHLEPNQPIAHAMLADTIHRIQQGVYDKILVRELDAGRSSYDFLNRGTGLREAIHQHYKELRRIPAVENVGEWWPPHMLGEVQVFERRGDGR